MRLQHLRTQDMCQLCLCLKRKLEKQRGYTKLQFRRSAIFDAIRIHWNGETPKGNLQQPAINAPNRK